MVKAMLCAFMLTGVVQGAHALPPKHEMNRLLLSAEKELAAENWDKAQVTLERLGQLGVEPPRCISVLHGAGAHPTKAVWKALPFLESHCEDRWGGRALQNSIDAINWRRRVSGQSAEDKAQLIHQLHHAGKAKSTNLPDQPFEPGHGATSDKGRTSTWFHSGGFILRTVIRKHFCCTLTNCWAVTLTMGTKLKAAAWCRVDTQLDVAPDRELIIQERHYE